MALIFGGDYRVNVEIKGRRGEGVRKEGDGVIRTENRLADLRHILAMVEMGYVYRMENVEWAFLG